MGHHPGSSSQEVAETRALWPPVLSLSITYLSPDNFRPLTGSRIVPNLVEGEEVGESKTNVQLPSHLPFSSKRILRKTITDHFHASSLTISVLDPLTLRLRSSSQFSVFFSKVLWKSRPHMWHTHRQNFQTEDISLKMKARAEELAKQSQVQ